MNEKKLILILEDDKLLLEALEDALKEEGYKVCTFTNELDLRKALSENLKPNLLVLDIMVPLATLTKENYEELTKNPDDLLKEMRLRRSAGLKLAEDILQTNTYPISKKVPIIFLTIFDKEDYKKRAKDLGADYFVKGTDDINKLKRIIKERLENDAG